MLCFVIPRKVHLFYSDDVISDYCVMCTYVCVWGGTFECVQAHYVKHEISLSYCGLNLRWSSAESLSVAHWLQAEAYRGMNGCSVRVSVSVCWVGVTGGSSFSRWSMIMHTECSAICWIVVRILQKCRLIHRHTELTETQTLGNLPDKLSDPRPAVCVKIIMIFV